MLGGTASRAWPLLSARGTAAQHRGAGAGGQRAGSGRAAGGEEPAQTHRGRAVVGGCRGGGQETTATKRCGAHGVSGRSGAHVPRAIYCPSMCPPVGGMASNKISRTRVVEGVVLYLARSCNLRVLVVAGRRPSTLAISLVSASASASALPAHVMARRPWHRTPEAEGSRGKQTACLVQCCQCRPRLSHNACTPVCGAVTVARPDCSRRDPAMPTWIITIPGHRHTSI